MFNIREFTTLRMEKMYESMKSRSNISCIKEACENANGNIIVMLKMDHSVSICTTVVSTEHMCGLTEPRFTTKFTSLEIRNSTNLITGFFKSNAPPIQKEVTNYLTILYNTVLDLAASGMSKLHSLNDLLCYRTLFYYYINKIDFMLSQWGELFQTIKIKDDHTNFNAQRKRIDKMELNHMICIGLPTALICGPIFYPFMIVANFTVCCWAPCFIACKIYTLDDTVEKDRIRRIKDKDNFW
jgi:hypothetical protein